MSRAKEWFPTDFNTDWSKSTHLADYGTIAAKFGEVLVSLSFGDYQGEYVFILRKDNKIGYCVQSYGSCSGCDWLQGCDSHDDLDKLIDSMENNIEWYNSPEELLARLNGLQEMNPSYIHENQWIEVEQKLREVLANMRA